MRAGGLALPILSRGGSGLAEGQGLEGQGLEQVRRRTGAGGHADRWLTTKQWQNVSFDAEMKVYLFDQILASPLD
jgi:hypothetical protein